MMGVAGILGGALFSAIHGATVMNTIYQDGGAYQWLQLIVFGPRYLVWLCCLYLLQVSGPLLLVRAYDFIS